MNIAAKRLYGLVACFQASEIRNHCYENINVSRIFRVIAVVMFSLKIIFWKLARRPKLSPLRMPDV